jgi:hypothetical protein
MTDAKNTPQLKEDQMGQQLGSLALQSIGLSPLGSNDTTATMALVAKLQELEKEGKDSGALDMIRAAMKAENADDLATALENGVQVRKSLKS